MTTRLARRTSPCRPGMLRHPSGPNCSPSFSTISGFTSSMSPLPSASTTKARFRMPICGAASPTPLASYIVSARSSSSLCRLALNLVTSFARSRKTGSGCWTIMRIAMGSSSSVSKSHHHLRIDIHRHLKRAAAHGGGQGLQGGGHEALRIDVTPIFYHTLDAVSILQARHRRGRGAEHVQGGGAGRVESVGQPHRRRPAAQTARKRFAGFLRHLPFLVGKHDRDEPPVRRIAEKTP